MTNEYLTKWQRLSERDKTDFVISCVKEEDTEVVKKKFLEMGFKEKVLNDEPGNAGLIDMLADDPVAAFVDQFANGIEALCEYEFQRNGWDDVQTINENIRLLHNSGKISAINLPQVSKHFLIGEDIPTGEAFNKSLNKKLRLIRTDYDNMSIFDNGIGIDPADANDTIGSYHNSGKPKIECFQGKFGHGSKATLRHCDMQFHIFRKHPMSAVEEANNQFGMMLIYKVDTDDRLAAYYVKAIDSDGSVPSFKAALGLPILPKGNGASKEQGKGDPYGYSMHAGLYTKYYAYKLGNLRSTLMAEARKHFSAWMPGMEVPITVQDRSKDWGSNSPDGTLVGLLKRLKANENHMEIPPFSQSIKIDSTTLNQETFLLKDDDDRLFTKKYAPTMKYGLFLVGDGQTHHLKEQEFFHRKFKDQFTYIWRDLMVFVHLDNLSPKQLRLIIDPSRQRAVETSAITKELYTQIIGNLSNDRELKAENHRRGMEKRNKVGKDGNPKSTETLRAQVFKSYPELLSDMPVKTGDAVIDKDFFKPINPTKDYPDYFELEQPKKFPKDVYKDQNYSRVRCFSNAKSDYFKSGRGNYEFAINGKTKSDPSEYITLDISRGGLVHLKLSHEQNNTPGKEVNYVLKVWDDYEGRNFDDYGFKDKPFVIDMTFKHLDSNKKETKTPDKPSEPDILIQEVGGQIKGKATPVLRWVTSEDKIVEFNKKQMVDYHRLENTEIIYLNAENETYQKAIFDCKGNKTKQDKVNETFEIVMTACVLGEKRARFLDDQHGMHRSWPDRSISWPLFLGPIDYYFTFCNEYSDLNPNGENRKAA